MNVNQMKAAMGNPDLKRPTLFGNEPDSPEMHCLLVLKHSAIRSP